MSTQHTVALLSQVARGLLVASQYTNVSTAITLVSICIVNCEHKYEELEIAATDKHLLLSSATCTHTGLKCLAKRYPLSVSECASITLQAGQV